MSEKLNKKVSEARELYNSKVISKAQLNKIIKIEKDKAASRLKSETASSSSILSTDAQTNDRISATDAAHISGGPYEHDSTPILNSRLSAYLNEAAMSPSDTVNHRSSLTMSSLGSLDLTRECSNMKEIIAEKLKETNLFYEKLQMLNKLEKENGEKIKELEVGQRTKICTWIKTVHIYTYI